MGETPCSNSLSFSTSCSVVAPYAADINTEDAGTVRYTDFDTYLSTGLSMTNVNEFIGDQTGDSFFGTKMMVAEWNSVSKFGGHFVSFTSTMHNLTCHFTNTPFHS